MAKNSVEPVIPLHQVLEEEFAAFHDELPRDYREKKAAILRKHTEEIKDQNERQRKIDADLVAEIYRTIHGLPKDERIVSGPGVLNIQKTKWIITPTFDEMPDSKARLYGLVLASLLDGTFRLLRSCKQCERAFVADDLRRKFCSDQCSKEYYNKTDVSRVTAWRERQRKKRTKRAKQCKRNEDIRILKFFLKKADCIKGGREFPVIRKIPARWKSVND